MKNRTRYTLAAILVAFTVGCSTPTDPPAYDACPNMSGDQSSVPAGYVKDSTGNCVPEPKYSLVITIEEPKIGTTVARGQSLICKASVKEENAPAGSTLTTAIWRIDGNVVDCQTVSTDKGPELVSGPASPVTAGLSLGSHTVSVEYCNSKNGECRLASSQVVVTVPPDMIVMAVRQGVYPNEGDADIWAGDDKAGSTAVRQTNSGGSKWFAAAFPDGSGLLWVTGINQYLWRSEMDGNNPVRYNLEWEGQILRPEKTVVSPNSKKIAFMASIGQSSSYSAFVMNVDGSSIQRILPDKEGLVPDIAWFPNSQSVVVGWAENDELGLSLGYLYFQVSLEGGVKTLFSIDAYKKYWLSRIRDVSPSGEWLMLWDVFGSDQAFLVRTDGSGEVKDVPLKVWEPVFCPNGNEVCYLSNWTEVSSVDFNGQNVQKLFSVPVSGWADRLYRWNRSN